MTPKKRTNLSGCGNISMCDAKGLSRKELEEAYTNLYGKKPKRGVLKKNLRIGMFTAPEDSLHNLIPSVP